MAKGLFTVAKAMSLPLKGASSLEFMYGKFLIYWDNLMNLAVLDLTPGQTMTMVNKTAAMQPFNARFKVLRPKYKTPVVYVMDIVDTSFWGMWRLEYNADAQQWASKSTSTIDGITMDKTPNTVDVTISPSGFAYSTVVPGATIAYFKYVDSSGNSSLFYLNGKWPSTTSTPCVAPKPYTASDLLNDRSFACSGSIRFTSLASDFPSCDPNYYPGIRQAVLNNDMPQVAPATSSCKGERWVAGISTNAGSFTMT